VTVDTGERRTFFGRTARHLITCETRRGPIDSTTELDGWHVDSELLPAEKRGAAVYMLASGNARPRLTVKQYGPAPTGLAVYETQISDFVPPNGSRQASERTVEVTDLVEVPLPEGLFTPPAEFKRVVTFTGDSSPAWTDRLRLEWEWLEDWLSSLLG
jgi:hypothetical protein